MPVSGLIDGAKFIKPQKEIQITAKSRISQFTDFARMIMARYLVKSVYEFSSASFVFADWFQKDQETEEKQRLEREIFRLLRLVREFQREKQIPAVYQQLIRQLNRTVMIYENQLGGKSRELLFLCREVSRRGEKAVEYLREPVVERRLPQVMMQLSGVERTGIEGAVIFTGRFHPGLENHARMAGQMPSYKERFWKAKREAAECFRQVYTERLPVIRFIESLSQEEKEQLWELFPGTFAEQENMVNVLTSMSRHQWSEWKEQVMEVFFPRTENGESRASERGGKLETISGEKFPTAEAPEWEQEMTAGKLAFLSVFTETGQADPSLEELLNETEAEWERTEQIFLRLRGDEDVRQLQAVYQKAKETFLEKIKSHELTELVHEQLAMEFAGEILGAERQPAFQSREIERQGQDTAETAVLRQGQDTAETAVLRQGQDTAETTVLRQGQDTAETAVLRQGQDTAETTVLRQGWDTAETAVLRQGWDTVETAAARQEPVLLIEREDRLEWVRQVNQTDWTDQLRSAMQVGQTERTNQEVSVIWQNNGDQVYDGSRQLPWNEPVYLGQTERTEREVQSAQLVRSEIKELLREILQQIQSADAGQAGREDISREENKNQDQAEAERREQITEKLAFMMTISEFFDGGEDERNQIAPELTEILNYSGKRWEQAQTVFLHWNRGEREDSGQQTGEKREDAPATLARGAGNAKEESRGRETENLRELQAIYRNWRAVFDQAAENSPEKAAHGEFGRLLPVVYKLIQEDRFRGLVEQVMSEAGILPKQWGNLTEEHKILKIWQSEILRLRSEYAFFLQRRLDDLTVYREDRKKSYQPEHAGRRQLLERVLMARKDQELWERIQKEYDSEKEEYVRKIREQNGEIPEEMKPVLGKAPFLSVMERREEAVEMVTELFYEIPELKMYTKGLSGEPDGQKKKEWIQEVIANLEPQEWKLLERRLLQKTETRWNAGSGDGTVWKNTEHGSKNAAFEKMKEGVGKALPETSDMYHGLGNAEFPGKEYQKRKEQILEQILKENQTVPEEMQAVLGKLPLIQLIQDSEETAAFVSQVLYQMPEMKIYTRQWGQKKTGEQQKVGWQQKTEEQQKVGWQQKVGGPQESAAPTGHPARTRSEAVEILTELIETLEPAEWKLVEDRILQETEKIEKIKAEAEDNVRVRLEQTILRERNRETDGHREESFVVSPLTAVLERLPLTEKVSLEFLNLFLAASRDRYESSVLAKLQRGEKHLEKTAGLEPEGSDNLRLPKPEGSDNLRLLEPERSDNLRLPEPERSDNLRLPKPEESNDLQSQALVWMAGAAASLSESAGPKWDGAARPLAYSGIQPAGRSHFSEHQLEFPVPDRVIARTLPPRGIPAPVQGGAEQLAFLREPPEEKRTGQDVHAVQVMGNTVRTVNEYEERLTKLTEQIEIQRAEIETLVQKQQKLSDPRQQQRMIERMMKQLRGQLWLERMQFGKD